MSLKRKASFSAMAAPTLAPVVAGPSVVMEDAPQQHLHSRTRKRFRDDRPDEKTVYQNTLRWLFTAQQRQVSAPSIVDGAEDESMDSEEPLPTPETVDPRQQTISKFFKPSPSSRTPSSSHHHTSQRPENRLPADNGLLKPYSLHINAPMTSLGSLGSDNTRSPSSRTTGTDVDMDMDMDMDMDSGSDESAQGFQRANGGFGWM